MSRIVLNNLSIFLTDRCNFKCLHCMRGKQVGAEIKESTLVNLFKQVKNVENITICGGEPFTRLDLIEMLINVIMDENVTINEFGVVTNGTLFTSEIESILDKINEYALTCPCLANIEDEEIRCHVSLSIDDYHKMELERIKKSNNDLFEIYRDNIIRLFNSKYYDCSRDLSSVFNLGNATKLDMPKVEHRPIPKIYYQYKDIIFAGLILSMLDDGTISECDGPLDYLKEKYNYGNINNDSLEDIIKKISKKVKSLGAFNRKKEKILTYYQTYS